MYIITKKLIDRSVNLTKISPFNDCCSIVILNAKSRKYISQFFTKSYLPRKIYKQQWIIKFNLKLNEARHYN